MRLLVRFVLLLGVVFGVSLAFAWAWDSSDPHGPARPAVAAVGPR